MTRPFVSASIFHALVAITATHFATTPTASATGRCALAEPCVFTLSDRMPVTARDEAAVVADSGQPCKDAPAFVVGPLDERARTCSAVKWAADRLANCGIRPRSRIVVEIADQILGTSGNPIFGRYDRVHDIVMITRSSRISTLADDTPYATLALPDFYASAVVHETVHAIMEQNTLALPDTRSAQEYPAYALQIESLPAASRTSFLRQFDLADPAIATDVFSDAILMLDPYVFAARAYTHFTGPEGGCTSLRALLAGHVTFIVPQ